MSSRDEYIRKMQAKLEEWNAEIDKLSAKAGDVTAEVKIEYSDHIESLKAKQATFVTLNRTTPPRIRRVRSRCCLKPVPKHRHRTNQPALSWCKPLP